MRRCLRQAQADAETGVINKEFVDRYIDKIFATPEDSGTLRLQIKLFTGEVTDKYLTSLRGRTGHTFMKMVEAYEQNLSKYGCCPGGGSLRGFFYENSPPA